MNNEYVIINKTLLEKRIEELDNLAIKEHGLFKLIRALNGLRNTLRKTNNNETS